MRINKQQRIITIHTLLYCVLFLIVALSHTNISSLSFLSQTKQLESSQSHIGKLQINGISNPTSTSKIPFYPGSTISCSINISLSADIDALLRAKLSLNYFNNANQLMVREPYCSLNIDSSFGSWTQNENCFYFNGSIRDITTLPFITSITFDNNSLKNILYNELFLQIHIEAEVIQQKSIDYSNHPWSQNAPNDWLIQAQNNFERIKI